MVNRLSVDGLTLVMSLKNVSACSIAWIAKAISICVSGREERQCQSDSMRKVCEPARPRRGPPRQRSPPSLHPLRSTTVPESGRDPCSWTGKAVERLAGRGQRGGEGRTPSSFWAFSASKLDGIPPLPPATPRPPVEPEPLMRLSISLAASAAMVVMRRRRCEVRSSWTRGGLPRRERVRCRPDSAAVRVQGRIGGEGEEGEAGPSRGKAEEGQLVSLCSEGARSTVPYSLHILQRLSPPATHHHELPSRSLDVDALEKAMKSGGDSVCGAPCASDRCREARRTHELVLKLVPLRRERGVVESGKASRPGGCRRERHSLPLVATSFQRRRTHSQGT